MISSMGPVSPSRNALRTRSYQRLPSNANSDSRTCCLHPASATHRQMTDEQLDAAGVGADLIRLSCGLENVQDLLADLEQAIEKV